MRLEPSVRFSLVLLKSSDGSHHVHIAPEAFTVASNEFRDNIEFWQQALPGHQKDQLALVCMLGPAWSLRTAWKGSGAAAAAAAEEHKADKGKPG